MPDQPTTIRRLGPEEAELLERPLPGPFGFAFEASRAWAFLALRSNVMIAALEGRHLVGFAAGHVLLDPLREPSLYLSQIEVHAERRRQGIGGRLMRAMLEAGLERGCDRLWLRIDAEDPAARAFCESLGAEREGASEIHVWPL